MASFSSEDPPYSEELDAARKAQDELSPKISLVEERILSLRQQIIALEREKELLKNSFRHHALVLSPLRRIPDDVLREIFLNCLPPELERYRIAISPLRAPVLLTHVCRRWRRVSTDHSLLWRWLILSLNKPMVTGTGIDILTEVVFRARLGPLKLQFLLAHDSTLSHHFSFSGLLNRSGVSHSLTSLVLSQVPVANICTIPSGSFPSLERLTLYFQEGENSCTLTQPIAAFEDCPALRRVAVNRCFTSVDNVSLLAFPWNQLTHFVSTDIEDNADAAVLLTSCFTSTANLQYLSTKIVEDIPEINTLSLPQISLVDLQTLSIDCLVDGYENMQLPDFFVALEFPNLQRLRLCAGAIDLEYGSWTPLQVQTFLSKLRNFRNLQYLSLNMRLVFEATMRQLLEAVSQITTLDIHVLTTYNKLFSCLTLGPDASTHLLPRLQTLILETWFFSPSHFDEDVLSQFLESRLKGSNRLEKVVVYGDSPEALSEEWGFIRCIQKYVPDGLLFERRIVEKNGDYPRHAYTWMSRDSELQDWPEVHRSYLTDCD